MGNGSPAAYLLSPMELEGPPSGGMGARAKDAPEAPFGPTRPPAEAHGNRTGLRTTLVVLLTVCVGIIVLYAWGRHSIRRAEEAEARTELERIGALAIATHAATGRICPTARGAVPQKMPIGNGWSGYQSMASDWTEDKETNAGFACLGFERTAPQYYQYRYEATDTGFTATATGQLGEDKPARVLAIRGALIDGRLVIVESP